MADPQQLLQEGLDAFRARDYEQALRSWKDLLAVEPDHPQVQELIERTETLASEGSLIRQLKEELSDLREELALTRSARNDLLLEIARLHRHHEQREAKLWRAQEHREWELREALAKVELQQLEGLKTPTILDAKQIHPAEYETLLRENESLKSEVERLQQALEGSNAANEQAPQSDQTISELRERIARNTARNTGRIPTLDAANLDTPKTSGKRPNTQRIGTVRPANNQSENTHAFNKHKSKSDAKTFGRTVPSSTPPPMPPHNVRQENQNTAETKPLQDTAPQEPLQSLDLASISPEDLASALVATPEPVRMHTGLQPDLPDLDLLEEEPLQIVGAEYENHILWVPVRENPDALIEHPIANYLITHIDGISTFKELRGSVGLPADAADEGFRFLLDNDIIRAKPF